MATSDFDLVLFGGTGDLSMRKLLPALYARERARDLPADARIICLGRDEKSREDFLKLVEKDSKPHVPAANLDASVWDRFTNRLQYASVNAKEADSFSHLKEALREVDGLARVFYLATPPSLFASICENQVGS